MADYLKRIPGNVPGEFFVDEECIDCDLCRETAPGIFGADLELGKSLVVRQPANPGELQQAREAMDACPVDAIGCLSTTQSSAVRREEA
jgi:ferredoxin